MKQSLFALALMSALVAQAEDTEGSVLSTNTFGVLKVSSEYENTLVAIPWANYSDGTEKPIPVTNLVRVTELGEGDSIIAYNDKTKKYDAWTVSSGQWTADKMWDGSKPMSKTDAPTTAEGLVGRGRAFWLCRGSGSVANPFYLYGQSETNDVSYVIASGSTDNPVFTLLANPFPTDLDLNATSGTRMVVDAGNICSGEGKAYDTGDAIMVTTGDAKTKIYYYQDGKWGFVSRGSFKTEGVTVPMGLGFAYVRRGSTDLTLKFVRAAE